MKKTLLFVGAIAIVLATIPMFAAWEAHVINVTAHIENALTTHGGPIEFGTVFPQEDLERDFDIQLSQSFQTAEGERVDTVEYVIKQKPKCKPVDPTNLEQYAPVHYATHECPEGYRQMLSLCPFLSKLPKDHDNNLDQGVPSYFVPATSTPAFCLPYTGEEQASGSLSLATDDRSDNWTVDLKVPPVDGYVGQEWPNGCPVVEEDSQDYGCDLWIEVTDIYEAEN